MSLSTYSHSLQPGYNSAFSTHKSSRDAHLVASTKPYPSAGTLTKSGSSRTSTFASSSNNPRQQSLLSSHSSTPRGQGTLGRKSNVIRIDARNQVKGASPSDKQLISSAVHGNSYVKVSSIRSPNYTNDESFKLTNFEAPQNYTSETNPYSSSSSDLPPIPPPMTIGNMNSSPSIRRPNSSGNFETTTSTNTYRNQFHTYDGSGGVKNVTTYVSLNEATLGTNTYSSGATLPYQANECKSVMADSNAGNVLSVNQENLMPSPMKENFGMSGGLNYTNLKSDASSNKSENTKIVKNKYASSRSKHCSRRSLYCIIIVLITLLFLTLGLFLFMNLSATTSTKCDKDFTASSKICKKETKTLFNQTPVLKTTKSAKKIPPCINPTLPKGDCTKYSYFQKQNDARERLCTTPDCIQIAGEVISKLNRSVDPCDDFYEFACGGWIAKNPIPAGRASYGVISKIVEENERLLYEILTRPIPLGDETVQRGNNQLTEAEKKAKIFYQSCISISQINTMGAQPMLDLISQMGGWDALGTWKEATWDFSELLYRIQGVQSVSVFFSMSIELDERNASKNVLRIDQDGVTMPDRSFYFMDVPQAENGRPTVASVYKRLIRKLLKLFGAVQSVDTVVEEIFAFEKKLAEIMVNPEEILRPGEELFTIRQVTEMSPKIDWFRLFKRIIKKSSVNYDTKISIASKVFLENLSALIRNSPRRTLHNYMMWRATVTKAVFLSTPFRQAILDFTTALYGPQKTPPLWKDCLMQVNDNFEAATGALFVREVFSVKNKRSIENIARDVRNSFQQNLAGVPWMDNSTRQAAIEKLKAMTVKVGYEEDLIQSPQKLDEYYNLPVYDCCYFTNVLNSVELKIKKSVEKIFKSSGADERRLSPQTVNAYYSPVKNQMVFPAGLLQSPLYNEKSPMALNYGAIGSIIGHEMTHGYDNTGEIYDKFGNENPWWSSTSKQMYRKQAQCVIDVYKDFSIGNIFVQPAVTLDENIADISGLKLAYKAYKSRMTGANACRESFSLPGTGLNNDQLLFVGFAQNWCSKSKMLSYQMQMQQDHHAPERFRVLGSVMQLKEFSTAFNCPVNSPMNPSEKCSVW